MNMDTLILNRYDLTLTEGLTVDLDVCKFLKSGCLGIPTAVTDGDILLSDLSTDLLKYLSKLSLSGFTKLRLASFASVELLKYLGNIINCFKLKVVTLDLRLNSKHFSDSITYIIDDGFLKYFDIVVMDFNDLSYVAKDLSSGSLSKIAEALYNRFGCGNLLLINYIRDSLYYNALYSNGEYVELGMSFRCSKDLVGAYLTLKSNPGIKLVDLLRDALNLCKYSFEFGLRLNHELVIPNVYSTIELDAERYKVVSELSEAVKLLEDNSDLVINLTPKVQMNVAYALPKPFFTGLNDVAAIPGRIIRINNRVKAVDAPKFGASKHLARALMKIMEFNPNMRSIANIRYGNDVLEVVKELGYTCSYYDRREEPPEVKLVEGASIPWGVEQAIKRIGYVPDVIYHTGDYGKEAMIAVIGRNPLDVVNKILRIGIKLRDRIKDR